MIVFCKLSASSFVSVATGFLELITLAMANLGKYNLLGMSEQRFGKRGSYDSF